MVHEKNAKISSIVKDGAIVWSHGYSTSPVDVNYCKKTEDKKFDMFEIEAPKAPEPEPIVEEKPVEIVIDTISWEALSSN